MGSEGEMGCMREYGCCPSAVIATTEEDALAEGTASAWGGSGGAGVAVVVVVVVAAVVEGAITYGAACTWGGAVVLAWALAAAVKGVRLQAA